MQNLYNDLAKLLEKDDRVFAEGKILKNKVTELALKLDGNLLKILLKNEQIKKHFFAQVDTVLVFDQDKFVKFINNKEFLPDSFTIFKNHIGLASNDEYLKDNGKVVLAWPYKDCVLEGGQDKEDVKRSEIFYNEILAPDEIDRLFEPKALTSFKRIDKTGEHKVEQITNQDNLIIKGNNLLALHSLKMKYRGKIKLVYIDPPYNTGNDGFNYNDSFNHSTWLTFMKNRLQIAKELMRDDGIIFVQCDDNEQAYLKVLMDEIFGRDNYRNSIYWHRTYAGKTISKNLPSNIDTLLFYSKNISTGINNVTKELTEIDIASFTKDDNDGRGKYGTVSLQKTGGPGPQTTYDYKDNNGKIWKCPLKGWRMTKEKLKALENDNRLYISDKTLREKYYLNERLEIGKQIDNLWNDIGNMNRSKGEDTGFAGQKPEKLIQRIIDFVTSKNDIVLDYHIGSGTTVAVAHKMGRRYIGVEQLDYGDNDSMGRLKKVISGDQNGISKAVNWKGGGSFVYMELKEWNEEYMQAIQDAKTAKELSAIHKKMQKQAFFRYDIDLSKFDQKQFAELPLEDQKKVLLECLDKNHLYVNLSEMNDATYKIPAEEKKINKQFYGNEH
ncbi:MAG: site-specific DNA-methyltransferase [Candidatus Taylorbacteria bacterium]|nr:site-specific DNA-methyltransferase [Candidatus Taylorbacteria bacterium]